MNNIDIANGMIFQEMAIKKDSFDDRLLTQKKVYLLQSLGTDLGYSYSWYIRGPYSRSLTTYIYNNLNVLSNSDFSKYTLSDNAKRNVENVNSLLDDREEPMEEAAWYELLASLLYICNNKESWAVDDQDESLFKALIKYKPKYSSEQCQRALNILREKGFVEDGA